MKESRKTVYNKAIKMFWQKGHFYPKMTLHVPPKNGISNKSVHCFSV